MINMKDIERIKGRPGGFSAPLLAVYAVICAKYEGRPVDADWLSKYLGIDREVMNRHLAELAELGLVELTLGAIFRPAGV